MQRERILFPEENMLLVDPPAELKTPLKINGKILLGPGPSNPSPAVYDAMGQPLLGYLHPSFLKLEPGDKVLIAQHGLWGERAAEISNRIGANVSMVQKPLGHGFNYEEIEQAIKKHHPVVFFMCHSESSTGVMQPLEGLGDLCHANGCLFLVDTVASLGGVPFSADKLNIDCVYSASQKVLGCPPGLAPISFSQKGIEKVLNRKTKPISFYMDVKLIANYWGCDGDVRKYHHTGPINLIYGLRASTADIVNEGLENVTERHRLSAQRLYDGLEKLGLELFVQNPTYRLPTLTTVHVPQGVDWKKVVDHLYNNYNIDIAGGLGATAGKIWRIGLMGYNSTFENVDLCLKAMEEALKVGRS
uniref:Alanine--glyoxylate aminotransferase n=1 Tax=Romanomermis culicivorax TaxID=13658 RepID=A0A915J532_ROMCU